MRPRSVLSIAAVVALVAAGMAPTVFAFSGSISCVSGCTGPNNINLTGPGSTGTATFWLHASDAPGGTTMQYFVCPQGSPTCSSASGTDNGWSWAFTPTSGLTGTSAPCEAASSCEGNGVGSPDTLTLSLTAPSVVTLTNQHEHLTIYACAETGTDAKCSALFTEVASLTIVANVPEFTFGIAAVLLVGLLGLFLVKQKGLPKLPTAI